MKAIRQLIALHVRTSNDLTLFIGAITLIICSILWLLFDLWSLFQGTLNPNQHLPLLPGISFGALGLICLWVLRHTRVP